MTQADIENLTIADISPRIRSGEISPVQLTDLYLDRIARLNPKIHAYTTVLAESAKAEAKTAEQEIRNGNYRSPLHPHGAIHCSMHSSDASGRSASGKSGNRRWFDR
jgi:Asp-tRNA(Asn)/Glu-tRNA(Gln) amidotransferase A subunit family amidase